MKVLRLVMNSFGNQYDKIIDFSNGVNLIMGSDDETLETVRSFIDGMLFGLSPENKKRYNPEPYAFSGAIYLEDEDGLRLKVERDFDTDQYSVTTSNGDDVTADYSDEYGNLALLPVSDTVFASEVLEKPETPVKSLKKLSELKEKRQAYLNRHDYDGMLEERDKLLVEINAQKEIEDKLEQNTAEISQKELRISQLSNFEGDAFVQLDEQVKNIEHDNKRIDHRIKEIQAKESIRKGNKNNILKRNIQGADDQLELIDRRIQELNREKFTYESKLNELQDSFTIDRDELKQDYEIYQDELKRRRGENQEQFILKLAKCKTWIYILAILLGATGIGIALYNPVDSLGRVVIFLICFVSIFMILFSGVTLYLKHNLRETLALADGVAVDQTEGDCIKAIVRKYNQKSPEGFEELYANTKRIYVRINNLKSDLTDIRRELGIAQTEREKVLDEQQQAQSELEKNSENDLAVSNDSEIKNLLKQKKANLALLEEIEEERKTISANSIWKLKEESLQLEEKNKELRRLSNGNDKVVDTFNKLQRRIDRFESKLIDYDTQIQEIENSLENSKEDFLLSYASPGKKDYKLKMAKQFGFGLQKNLDQGMDVPFITFNPITIAGTEDARLIEKLKRFIQNKQVLIFSSTLHEKMILTKHQIKHNGIFIADRKAS